MTSYTAQTKGELIAVRLNRGDDIIQSIEQVIEERGIVDAVIVSGIGTVDQCVLHFVTDAQDAKAILYKEWKDVLFEVAGMQGIIANGKPHIHAVVSNSEQSWAGHVEPGCRTLYLCEIVIMLLEGKHFDRVHATENTEEPDYAIMNLVKQ